MLNLINFFRILFNTSRISDLNLRKFCEDNLQRMIANNPGGIYTILITDTTTAYNGYYGQSRMKMQEPQSKRVRRLP